MKIISWNVNGIRAVAKKGFLEFITKQKPDILCLQEIKISDTTRKQTEFDFAGYEEYWNSAERPGYSGTVILIKTGSQIFLDIKNGFGEKKFDIEGRVQTLETKDFYLLNVYFPNSNHELSRLGYKLEFNEQLLKYAKKLEKKKPVIITGDFNVAHQEIDLARPKENVGNPGFTAEERAFMDKFLAAGFIDTYRALNGDKIQYSWWSFRSAARQRNIGWRIDYFCVSDKLKKYLKKAYILDQITGSDHAPVGLEINNY
ncbi:MAG TPA: exodeoxyribonuclease III [Candidatus Saccharimonadales bacterium]|nr:exodeoxyribonuclease III [Candidatus Saccharimonadales bacterium]